MPDTRLYWEYATDLKGNLSLRLSLRALEIGTQFFKLDLVIEQCGKQIQNRHNLSGIAQKTAEEFVFFLYLRCLRLLPVERNNFGGVHEKLAHSASLFSTAFKLWT